MNLASSDPTQLSTPQKRRVDELLDELFDLPEPRRLTVLRAARAPRDFLGAPAPPAADPVIPHTTLGVELDGWRLTRLIGRGGMGEVYEAVRVQGDFNQRVAIKLLQPESGALLQRFESERQILATLEHPGIARLYDGGITRDGRPFMVMEFV